MLLEESLSIKTRIILDELQISGKTPVAKDILIKLDIARYKMLELILEFQ